MIGAKQPNRFTKTVVKAESAFQGLDHFGQTYSMKIDQEKSILQTSMGSLCSIILLCIVTSYSVQKFNVWVERKDVDILWSTNDSFYDYNYNFTHAHGMNFAIALTEYDNDVDPIMDPSIGRLIFNHYSWG